MRRAIRAGTVLAAITENVRHRRTVTTASNVAVPCATSATVANTIWGHFANDQSSLASTADPATNIRRAMERLASVRPTFPALSARMPSICRRAAAISRV